MNLKEAKDDLESKANALSEFKDKFAKEFLERVKRRTPVVSGTLRDSLSIDVSSEAIELSSDVDYWQFPEAGTINSEPQRFVGRAVEEVDQITDSAKKALK